MPRLTGRTVIVTGAEQGIGATLAQALAGEGAQLALCGVGDPARTLAAIKAAGGTAFGAICDVSDAAAITHFAADVLGRFGRIDGLVNNAALFSNLRPGRFEDITSDAFDRVMQVNVRGTFECMKAVMPAMRAQGYGKIVNIASGTVYKGTPGLAHYTASKGAVIALTRVVARESGPAGIRANCIAPGFTLSEGIIDAAETQAINRATVASRCLPRAQQPEDLAGAVSFLLSAESDFITGQVMVVDGGSVMN